MADPSPRWHLAQLNIATIRHDLDSPEMADFVDNLDNINMLGERSPGFVWRHMDDTGASTATRPFADANILINFTVWEDVDSLRQFAYKTEHVDFLRRRREWFAPAPGYPVGVMWWIPAGTIPTLDDAVVRIELLRDEGPTPKAFTFRDRFDAPD